MARFLIVLGLLLATSMPGLARMAPMAMEHAASAVCTGAGCANRHTSEAPNHHMTVVCMTMACAGPLSLQPDTSTPTPRRYGAVPYEPLVASVRAGLSPMPDAPPPRSVSSR